MTPMRTLDQALALVRESHVVTLTPTPGLPSLVEAVVAGPVHGSWWGHPLGRVIYDLASRLEAHAEVRALKLVDGKVTFVHRSLWPPLLRVVCDPAWRASAQQGLSAEATRLLELVEEHGAVRLDEVPELTPKALRTARAELERRLLVDATQEHTAKGAHATVLRSVTRFGDVDARREAAAWTMDDALRTLREAFGEAHTPFELRPEAKA